MGGRFDIAQPWILECIKGIAQQSLYTMLKLSMFSIGQGRCIAAFAVPLTARIGATRAGQCAACTLYPQNAKA